MRVIVIFFLILLSPGTSFCQSEPDVDQLYNRLEAASFEVLVDGGQAGSGWFISPGGVGITAAHLVRVHGKISVRSPKFGILPARLISVDLGRDIAVLHVDRGERPYSYLTVSEQKPVPGQKLYLFGAPLLRHGILVSGEVARRHTQFEWNARNDCYTEVLSVSALTPEGFSGAAWVNTSGQVMGLQSGMMVKKGTLMGLAFMSPVLDIKELLANQRDRVTLTLGAMIAEPWEQPVGLQLRNGFASQGLTVQQTFASGSLASAGIVKGDTLLAVDDLPLILRDDLIRYVRQQKPGTQVLFSVRRKGGEVEDVHTVLAPGGSF